MEVMRGPAEERDLREALADVRHKLERAEELRPALRASLEEALEEVERALERTSSVGLRPEDAPSLADRVEGLALDFELEHPILAGVLNRITHQLASLGI